MGLVIDRQQAIHSQMGILLCRAQGRVSQHFLYRPEIGTFIEEVCGVGMS